MEASREIFWNIPLAPYFLYPIAAASLVILVYAFYKRYRLWTIGKPVNTGVSLLKRTRSFISAVVVEGIFHRRFFTKPYPDLMHFLMLAAAFMLVLGSFVEFINYYWIHSLQGYLYLVFSLVLDIGGVFIIIGVVMAAVRRYIIKPPFLKSTSDDAVVLILIFSIVVTGFFLEGFRITAAIPDGLSTPELYSHPDWASWSIAGYPIAHLFSGLAQNTRVNLYTGLWSFHVVLSLGAIVYAGLAFSKLSHIVISPVNIFLRSQKPRGHIVPVDIETDEPLGAGSIAGFTRKQLLELDACTQCGRCEAVCPASMIGKPLSPRKLLSDLKDSLSDSTKHHIPLPVTPESIWSCAGCYACEEVCPVYIEPVQTITDMRRSLIDRGEIDCSTAASLEAITLTGNPFHLAPQDRTLWVKDLGVKILKPGDSVDILLWVGCMGSYEREVQDISRAVVRILQSASIDFGIIGDREVCCGQIARYLGEEALFQKLAKENLEMLEGRTYKYNRILTFCPHCYNALKNQYSDFGAPLNVVHHTQFIAELIDNGKLNLRRTVSDQIITFHDPCYLGRVNNIFKPPRFILDFLGYTHMREMSHSREDSFCCGGQLLWTETAPGERLQYCRLEHAFAVDAGMVVTACPVCKIMFNEAIRFKASSNMIYTKDVAQLVADACF